MSGGYLTVRDLKSLLKEQPDDIRVVIDGYTDVTGAGQVLAYPRDPGSHTPVECIIDHPVGPTPEQLFVISSASPLELHMLDILQSTVRTLLAGSKTLHQFRSRRVEMQSTAYREAVKRVALDNLRSSRDERMAIFWLRLVRLVERHHETQVDGSAAEVEAFVGREVNQGKNVPLALLPHIWKFRLELWKAKRWMTEQNTITWSDWCDFLEDWRQESQALREGTEALLRLHRRSI